MEQQKTYLWWGVVGVGTVVCVLTFHAGTVYGMRAIRTAHTPPPPPRELSTMGGIRPPRTFIADGHGATGVVIRSTSNTLTIRTREGEEEIILIDDDTEIRNKNKKVSFEDIEVGAKIIVVGDPDDATTTDKHVVEAEVIRIVK